MDFDFMPIRYCYAHAFLPPVLECTEPVVSMTGNILTGSIDTEHPAFLAGFIFF
jgi:hypothetical protein